MILLTFSQNGSSMLMASYKYVQKELIKWTTLLTLSQIVTNTFWIKSENWFNRYCTIDLTLFSFHFIYAGATGSGKTTQVPQYILDEYAKDHRYCNIIVTQPRRIAAVSISKRVCQERGWTQGSLVGYQIGRDKCISEDTRLSYVTTDVLLNKLIQEKNMNQFTHVILDEVRKGSKGESWKEWWLFFWNKLDNS